MQLLFKITLFLRFIFIVLCVLCVSACECMRMILLGALGSHRYGCPGAGVADGCDDVGAGQ